MTQRLFYTPVIALGSRFHGHHCNRRSWLILLAGLAMGLMPLSAEDIMRSNFESSVPDYNPWAGVNDQGLIKVLPGKQPCVDNEGQTITPEFGPSVAVGDLNGDGLQDLVIGDSMGFFWYFPNSGTATVPKFTHAEIMPIWLGFSWGDPNYLGPDGVDSIIPKIQLVDLGGDGKKLDLVVGNYVGRLFYLRNSGSSSSPDFRMPKDRGETIRPTRKGGLLWCNFLSPFAYDWYGTGNLDLLMGDGTYSANSIYLLQNKGSRDRPVFNEDFTTKIIPGMGREHLEPQVVDWNNDGKPDIITGERDSIDPNDPGAHIEVFLNTSTDPKNPTFDQGHVIKFGSKDGFGSLTTVTVCDLNGNKLPNLIITNSAGEIFYAQNVGKPGSPLFGDPVPMRGVNPFPKIDRPIGWTLTSPHGVPHELLVCTNAKVQPGFEPPPNTTFKNAMRYWVYPVQNTYFKEFFYPDDEGPEHHTINYGSNVSLKEGVDYKVSFWIKTTGAIKDLHYNIRGWSHLPDDPLEEVNVGQPVNSSGAWGQTEDTVQFRLKQTKTKDNTVSFYFNFEFEGQGEIYLDDVRIQPADGAQ